MQRNGSKTHIVSAAAHGLGHHAEVQGNPTLRDCRRFRGGGNCDAARHHEPVAAGGADLSAVRNWHVCRATVRESDPGTGRNRVIPVCMSMQLKFSVIQFN